MIIYKLFLPVQFHNPSSKEIGGKSRSNMIPHTGFLGFWEPVRGIAKTAMPPLTRAAIAATANAGEFPPPNNWSHGPLPKDTIICFKYENI